jgi:hypothetical protein
MRSKRISLLLGLAALWSTPAQASEVFPGALQEAAGMQCVPVCLMCHTTNPGTAGTWTRPLGAALFNGGMRKGDTDSLKRAYKAFAANPANAAAVADIQAGREPGQHVDVCGPIYGCSVPMIAKQPAQPRDYTAALWVVSAVTVGGILRRRRKTNAR